MKHKDERIWCLWDQWVCCVYQVFTRLQPTGAQPAPGWALSAPTGCMLCQSKSRRRCQASRLWCHSHMDSGVVMLAGWEAELWWPAAAETAVEGFALHILTLIWTGSLMMYFVISAMKGKSKLHACPSVLRVTSRQVLLFTGCQL